jgi:hypothetical protein
MRGAQLSTQSSALSPQHPPRAAGRFNFSRSTLYRLIARHGIKTYRRAGDRRTYVSEAAVRGVTGFREV